MMDFETISNIFGGSIFPENYLIDITAAQEKITELKAVRSHGEILLLNAILHSITGDLGLFESLLREAKDVADKESDKLLSLRYCVYLKYCMRLMRTSPPLDFWSELMTEMEKIDEALAGYRGLSIELRETIDLKREIDKFCKESSAARIEDNTLLWIWEVTRIRWNEGFHNNPRYPVSPKRHLGIAFKVMLNLYTRDSQSQIQRVKRKLPKTAIFMQRAITECRLAGNDHSGISIQCLAKNCLDQDDQVSAANLYIVRGDRIYSEPWTSPLALNLMLHASGVDWDSNYELYCHTIETKPVEKDFDSAEGFYTKAFKIFKQQGCRRGMGAAKLRSACIRIRRIVDSLKPQDTVDISSTKFRDEWFCEVFKLLEETLDLFKFDEANTCLAMTHRLLLESLYYTQPIEKMLPKAEYIGGWGKKKKNPRISRFAGLLLLRVGRILSTTEKYINIVRNCCVISRMIFNKLEEPLLEARAVAACASLDMKLGHLPLSRENVILSCDILSRAQQRFFHSIHADDQKRFEDMWINIAQNFDRWAKPIIKNDFEASKKLGQKIVRLENGCGEQPFKFMSQIAQDNLNKTRQNHIAKIEQLKIVNRRVDDCFQLRRAIIKQYSDLDLANRQLENLPKQNGNNSLANGMILVANLNASLVRGEPDESRKLNLEIVPKILGGHGKRHAKFSRILPDLYPKSQMADVQLALLGCFTAQDWGLGREVTEKAIANIPSFLDDLKKDEHRNGPETIVALAAIKRNTGELDEATRWYALAIDRFEKKRDTLRDVEDRKMIVRPTFLSEAFSGIVSVFLDWTKKGSVKPVKSESYNVIWENFGSSLMDRAVACLEQGRARVLLDILTLRGNSEAYRKWLYHERLSQILTGSMQPSQNLNMDFGEVKKEMQRNADSYRLTSLLPDTEKYRRTPDILQPYYFIPEDAVVVTVNPDSQKTLIFYITCNGIQYHYQNSMTTTELERQVLGFLKTFRRLEDPDKPPEEASGYGQYLAMLSELIIKPAEKIISKYSHIVFIVSGSLNRFPMSTLYYKNEPLFLTKEVSICPSLNVFQNLILRAGNRRGNCKDQQQTSMIFAAPPEAGATEKQLNTSAASVVYMSSLYKYESKAAHNCSPAEVGKIYSKSNIMFIATHGRQPDNLGEDSCAWKYDLLLGPDSSFRVVDLLEQMSDAVLVVFEACISALIEDVGYNEQLGFSHMVLASGANAFIGAMWEVSDKASALLLFYLFQEIAEFKKLPASACQMTLASCFQRAQIALYNTDKNQAISLLNKFQESCRTEGNKLLNDDHRKVICKSLKNSIEDIEDETPDGAFLFRNPFYYAPFVLVGNGFQKIPRDFDPFQS